MIKRVRIQNFKSLADVTVDLGPVTVLIGRSGSGKSNFVEALRWLRDLLRVRNVESANEKYGGWERILPLTATQPTFIRIEITFTAPRIKEDMTYLLGFRQPRPQQHPQVQQEMLSLGETVLYHKENTQWIVPPKVSELPGGTIVLGTVMGLREDTDAHLILTRGVGCYAFPDSVLLQPQGNPGESNGLLDDGRNFLQVITAIHDDPERCHHIDSMTTSLKTLKNSLNSVDLVIPDRNRVTVTHDLTDRKLRIDLAQESEGFRRLLACLLALYQERPKQTVIFDEPEKGIYPTGLATLAESFKWYARQGRGQVLVTTHSPEFLNHFEPEEVRVVEMQDARTRIGPVSDEQFGAIKDKYLFMKELLTVDEARLSEQPVEAP